MINKKTTYFLILLFFTLFNNCKKNIFIEKPNLIWPTNNQINIDFTNINLLWECPNADNITFDIYFGTSERVIKIDSNISSSSYKVIGLDEKTKYFWKIEAKGKYNKVESDLYNFTISEFKCIDFELNKYKFVKIGNQIWMSENLKSTYYPNGEKIPYVSDDSAWANLDDNDFEDAFCFYNNNLNNEANLYGGLYTWAATIAKNENIYGIDYIQGICPDGWHVPNLAEWEELANYLGGYEIAGGKLKEEGTEHWLSPNVGATNESNFTAYASGRRDSKNGLFELKGNCCNFRSTAHYDSTANYIQLHCLSKNVIGIIGGWCIDKSFGLSVRCIHN